MAGATGLASTEILDRLQVGLLTCTGGGSIGAATVDSANAAAASLLGISAADLRGRSVADLLGVAPGDLGSLGEPVAGGGGVAATATALVQVPGGRWLRVLAEHLAAEHLPAEHHQGERLLVQLLDVSEHRAAEDALGDVERRFELAFRSAPIGMAIVGADGSFVQVNDRLAELLGYSASELERLGYEDVTHPDDIAHSRQQYGELLGAGTAVVTSEKRLVTRTGATVWVQRVATAVEDGDGRLAYFVVQYVDLTELRRGSEAISRLASTDQLTGLGNRAALRLRLAELLDDTQPSAGPEPAAGADARGGGQAGGGGGSGRRGRGAGLVVFDLDGFQRVNESLGHEAGDRVLRRFAELLQRTCPPWAVPYRLGGDEFAVVASGTDEGALVALAGAVVAAAGPAASAAAPEALVGASAGVVTPAAGTSPEDVLRQADLAVGTAKRAGGQRVVAFDAAHHAELLEELALQSDLRAAVAAERLEVHYQPVHRLADGLLHGVEALCRWTHPERGWVPPARFIPLAERSGLIHALGELVLRRACADLAGVNRRHGTRLSVAVNVSVRQLGSPGFAARVADLLAETGLPPELLTLEITESVMADQHGALDAVLHDLRRQGVGLALDDFGTGYSSLGRLRHGWFDTLKIDRSFVAEITEDGPAPAPALATAAVALGHGIGGVVVAEGVETELQVRQLQALGCDLAQGYLLGRPAPLDDLDVDAAHRPHPLLAPSGRPGSASRSPEGAPAAVPVLLDALRHATGLDAVYLTHIDWASGVQQVEAISSDGLLDIRAGTEVPWGDTLCRLALLGGVEAVEDAATLSALLAGAHGIGRYVAVAVLDGGGGTVGTLCGACRDAGPIEPGTVDRFRVCARMLGAAAGPG